MINNNVDDAHKEAAADFISYMASADTQKEMTLISSQPPVVKSVYEDADILEAIPFYSDFADIMQQENPDRRHQNMQSFRCDPEKCTPGITGEMEVKDALDTLQSELEELTK